MNVTHLECGLCGLEHEARRLLNLCRACGKPLLVRYDLSRSKVTLTRESLANRRPDMWRYREVLPVENDNNILSGVRRPRYLRMPPRNSPALRSKYKLS